MYQGTAIAPSVDQEPFEEKLTASLPKLKACAVYLTKDTVARTQDASIADDLLQRTCLRALSRKHQFRGESILAWMYQIMRSIWFSELRSQNIRATEVYQEEDHIDDRFETAMLSKLMISDIRRACSHITDEDFDLVVRFHCLDQTYDEIAKDLAISIWTLRSRITKTKERIVTRMRGLAEENEEKCG